MQVKRMKLMPFLVAAMAVGAVHGAFNVRDFGAKGEGPRRVRREVRRER